ncbi:hypothetical protein P3T23_003475 [Paraburkholderia sp. GAS448]|uniref:hypothetical protein n=1 Tax=Paraburkholderia sp. GAS448 TaxID=3035136 RepID=UPI003D2360FD
MHLPEIRDPDLPVEHRHMSVMVNAGRLNDHYIAPSRFSMYFIKTSADQRRAVVFR